MRASVPVAIALILATGCGEGSRPAPEPEPSPPPVPSPSPQAGSPEAASPGDLPVGCTDETFSGEVEVTLRQANTAFSPDCLVVLGGQSLVIQNEDPVRHNLTIEGTSVNIDTAPGETARTESIGGAVPPGTHTFFCTYHRARGMDGEITVTEAG